MFESRTESCAHFPARAIFRAARRMGGRAPSHGAQSRQLRGAFFAAAEAQTEFLDGDTEIVPGVRVEVGAGHTRCMQCVRVESEGDTAYFPSDLVPTNSHLAYPWMTSFDLYPLETLANKKRLLPELAEAKALLVFPHDPVCSLGAPDKN